MGAFIEQKEHSRDASQVDRFIQLLVTYAAMAEKYGVKIIPYTQDTIQRYISFDTEKQKIIYNRFLSQCQLCMSAIENGVDLNDNKHSLTWWALRQLKLRPPSDLFNYLENNDISEIYNYEGVQIFRSFNFFKLCIYPLDQILTYEWHELYKRDEGITAGMMGISMDIVARRRKDIYFSEFPIHPVEQILGDGSSKIYCKHRLVSPLYDENNQIFIFNAFQVAEVTN